MDAPKALWKLTIAPRAKTDPNADAFAFCKENSIIGVGWGYRTAPVSKEDLRNRFSEEFEAKRFAKALNMIVSRIAVGDHVWVYGPGAYHICRVTSDWQYEDGPQWTRHDIHNIREAEWREVPDILVPGLVRRSMTMRGAGQFITAQEHWRDYSHRIFRAAGSGPLETFCPDMDDLAEKLRTLSPDRLFEMLDPDETKDLIGLYLQEEHGWRMIKSSSYCSQRKFECEFTRDSKGRHEKTVMQVKSGDVPLPPTEYRDETRRSHFGLPLQHGGSALSRRCLQRRPLLE